MLATELKTGKIYKEETTPFLVLKYSHIKSARGGAIVKVKVRDLIKGSVFEKSYLATAKVEDADVIRKNAQYLYESNGYVFMDPDTYEQITIPKEIIGEQAPFLVEGSYIQVLYFENKPVSVDFPNSVTLEITYTEPGFKGNTVSNVYKDAKLSNNMSVKVPTFLKIGDKVKIDTRSCEYISKV